MCRFDFGGFRQYSPGEGKDGPGSMKGEHMARSSYQKGKIEMRSRKHGIVYVLRYRLRQGNGWIQKTEQLEDGAKTAVQNAEGSTEGGGCSDARD